MLGWKFKDASGDPKSQDPFERLFKLFEELIMSTSGDIAEALNWLTVLDRQYNLTDDGYGIADFIEDLKKRGYIQENPNRGSGNPQMVPTHKLEISIRKNALKDVFNDIKKSRRGNHNTRHIGLGDEPTSDIKPYQFGDKPEDIEMSSSLRNAQINHGLDDFYLTQEDLEVSEKYYQSQMSTVLMIDISHSMILYGEDRITPAKKVALALAELIKTRYPKDTLDIIVFGNDAWKIELKDLPYLQVGPYHTNTIAGLDLARRILAKKRNPNKQIMMITDGKPSCMKVGKKYYKNSFGLDRKIVRRTLSQAHKCKKQNIPITTFMIARDPYLMEFVNDFTNANNGKAFYSGLDGLGSFVFMDYKNNKGRKNR